MLKPLDKEKAYGVADRFCKEKEKEAKSKRNFS